MNEGETYGMTFDQRVTMYMKCPKSALVEMLVNRIEIEHIIHKNICPTTIEPFPETHEERLKFHMHSTKTKLAEMLAQRDEMCTRLYTPVFVFSTPPPVDVPVEPSHPEKSNFEITCRDIQSTPVRLYSFDQDRDYIIH